MVVLFCRKKLTFWLRLLMRYCGKLQFVLLMITRELLMIRFRFSDYWKSMRYLMLILLALVVAPTYAFTSVDLYKAEVAVQSNEPEIEQEARAEGMKQVLIRVTGDLNVVDNPDIKKALSESEQYLSQFGVVEADQQLVLRMEFDAKLIRELLTSAHLALWPNERAKVLVWLIDDLDFQRTILWENIDSPKIEALKFAAEGRGLPVMIPIGDFDNITKVEASDLWAGFVRPISAASNRYAPDAVLVIRNETEKATWSLYDQSAKEMVDVAINPQTGAATGEQRLGRIIDSVTQYYVAKNSVVVDGESSKSVLVQIDNLPNAMAFFSAEKVLKEMSSVASVDVVKLGDLYAIYRVHLLSRPENFKNEALNHPNLVMDQDAILGLEPVPPTEAILPSLEANEVQKETSALNSEAIVIRQTIPVEPSFIYHWQ
jgi:hypothetical protein